MAIILLGSTILGIRGSIGGVTYSAGLGGPYARAWSRGSNPRSPLQSTNRAYLGGCGAAWAGLTAGERADWDTFAAGAPETTYNSLGEVVTLSGWNYFARCNTRRLANGQGLILTRPTGADAIQPGTPTVDNFEVIGTPTDMFKVEWDVSGWQATDYGIVFVRVLPSGATVYTPSSLRFIASAGALVGEILAYPQFVLIFGAAQAGWTVSGKFHIQNGSGLRSVAVEVSDVVA